MKRSVVVEIDIDEDEPGYSYFEGDVDGDRNKFRIVVRKEITSIPVKYSSVNTLAHECGHMISEIFGLPGMKYDPRHPRREHTGKETFGELVMKSEREAWDLGALALNFDIDRRECLEHYESKYDLKSSPILSYAEVK
jgi:hypothetical protein